VKKLQEKLVPVYLISGGFRCIIEPIAAHLKIPMTNVFANELIFDTAGNTVDRQCVHRQYCSGLTFAIFNHFGPVC